MTSRVSRFAPTCLASLITLLTLGTAHADEVQVAVAANFAGPFQQIAAGFATATGHQATVSTGSTGRAS